MTSSPDRLACAGGAACRPTVECYRRRQTTTTDAREQNNSGYYTMCRGPVKRRDGQTDGRTHRPAWWRHIGGG